VEIIRKNDSIEDEKILEQVKKCCFGHLPSTLACKLMCNALLKYDNHQGIPRLLIIYLSLLEDLRCSKLVTPLYLYRWTAGRLILLGRLFESDVLVNCKDLSLDMYNFYHRQDVPQSWTYDAEPEFQLERVRLESREESLVEDLLSRLSHLVVLKLHTVCTDQMLEIISNTCQCLAGLDVSFSKNVSDSGIAMLCRDQSSSRKSVKELELEGTSITSKSILMLLESCNKLVNIESATMEDFLYDMQSVFSETSSFGDTTHGYMLKKLNLCIRKHSVNKPSLIHIVSVIFPNLEELQIHYVHPKEAESLKFMKDLVSLRSLMIGVVGLEYLKTTFFSIGMNLVTFRYVFYGRDSGQIDLSIIQQNCRNLRTLSLSGNCVVSDPKFGSKNEEIFPRLTDLHISTHSFIPMRVWSSLLATCTSLDKIDLTNCEGLNDDSLAQILDNNPNGLLKVTKVNIKGGHRGDVDLTERSVLMLHKRCSLLTQLGDCFTWSLYGDGSYVSGYSGTRGVI